MSLDRRHATGLRRTDDRTFVGAFQAIDTRIINPLFMLAFLGSLIVTGIAGLLMLEDGFESVLPWIALAFALYLLVVVITVVVNVPLNNYIKAAGPPDMIDDLNEVRTRFQEPRWVRWNLVRTVLTTIAFLCLAWALVLLGRVG